MLAPQDRHLQSGSAAHQADFLSKQTELSFNQQTLGDANRRSIWPSTAAEWCGILWVRGINWRGLVAVKMTQVRAGRVALSFELSARLIGLLMTVVVPFLITASDQQERSRKRSESVGAGRGTSV